MTGSPIRSPFCNNGGRARVFPALGCAPPALSVSVRLPRLVLRVSLAALLALMAACPTPACARRIASSAPGPGVRRVTVSLISTTDVHGHIESLPWLAGHLANLRARRAADGGGVLLVDSGDMFQGTLESNLGEGEAMIRGYNALGYAAAAIGNHEFDFGPAGPAHIPTGPTEDPRGALKARAAQARFPLLTANVHETATGKLITFPNVRPWTMLDVAGVKVAVIGGTTEGTPRATHPRNFVGLGVSPLPAAIGQAAGQARRDGAKVVVVITHAGGRCTNVTSADDLSSCDPQEEVFALARALPDGLVDVIAAGHTHQAVAHRVAGIPIVQAYSEGRAFSRVDLTIDTQAGRVIGTRIFPPRALCGPANTRVPSFRADACRPETYEGAPVRFDVELARTLAPDIQLAARRRAQLIGVNVGPPIWRATRTESPLGNLAADLMRVALPRADVAFINGGSLRADLPAGPLDYGRLYEAFPFDDGLATVRLTGDQLGRLVARNLGRSAGILSLAGLRAVAKCQAGEMQVRLLRPDGRAVDANTPLLAVTNGYLASGGDGLLEGIAIGDPPDATPMRDRFVSLLRQRGGTLRGDDPALYDPRHPRVDYPGQRPVRCR